MKNALIALLLLGTALSASAHESIPTHIAHTFAYRPASLAIFQTATRAQAHDDFSSPATIWVDFDLLARHLAILFDSAEAATPEVIPLARVIRPARQLVRFVDQGIPLSESRDHHVSLKFGRTVISSLPQAPSIWYARCQLTW